MDLNNVMVVRCGSKEGHQFQEDSMCFKREWTTGSRFVNHYGGPIESFNEKENLHFENDKISRKYDENHDGLNLNFPNISD